MTCRACSTRKQWSRAARKAARGIFLCASTLNSTWLLLRSATGIWPGGLGSSSGELGHNLMDHHFRLGAEGTIEGLEDKHQFGQRPNPSYIPRYRNLMGDKRDYLRGFGYEGGASRANWSRAVAELGIGVLNKHNQVWDARNLFVTDGACMTSTACKKPTFSYMALTARHGFLCGRDEPPRTLTRSQHAGTE